MHHMKAAALLHFSLALTVMHATHLCSHCCVSSESRGSTDSCRSPLCSYRSHCHTAVSRTRPDLEPVGVIAVLNLTVLALLAQRCNWDHGLKTSEKWHEPKQLTNTHGLVPRWFEATGADAVIAPQRVNALTRIANTRVLTAFITVWKGKITVTLQRLTEWWNTVWNSYICGSQICRAAFNLN